MKAILASNNAHKLIEIRAMLGNYFEEILSLKDVGIDIDIEETGTTFLENSLIKARTICNMTHMVVIADDSGLCVEALDNAPGVYSARFAGEPCNDDNNNALLLEKLHYLEKTQPINRTAFFASVVTMVMPNGDFLFGEGRVYGTIIDEYRGTNGFGYDPIFLCNELNLTFGQADAQQKNSISHRSRAIAQLLEKYEKYCCN